MEKYRVVKVEPKKEPYVKEIGTKLKDLQSEVDGLIEIIYAFDGEDVCIVGNDEGKIKGMELNRPLIMGDEVYDIICGDFFIIGLTEDSFRSLTDKEVETYMELFEKPYSRYDLLDMLN